MKRHRLICFLFAVWITGCTLLVSCQSAGNAEQTPVSETAAETDNGKENEPFLLPDVTFDGYEFRVLARPQADAQTIWIADLFAEPSDGTRVGIAVNRRNAWVCDQLDCKLTYSLTSDSNMETDALIVLSSGEDAYDLLMPHGRSIMTYANEGYLLDWERDLPYCDLDRPWWDQKARETFSINHKLYVMNGDISYLSIGYTFAMFFNKDLMDGLGIEYPYDLVKSGDWTFDTFRSMAIQGTKDLDGDTRIEIGTDRVGYSTHEHGGSFQIMYASGSRLLLKDEDDIPYCPGVTEVTDTAYARFYELIDSQDANMYFNSNGDRKVDIRAEQALFWDTYVSELVNMGDYEFDYGLVPWPNFEEGKDGYSCHVSCYVHEFGVPFTVSDPARTSAIIEALAYGGHTQVIDEYFEQTLQYQKTQDEESKEMLEIIRRSRAYDLGFFQVSLEPLSSMGNLIAMLPSHSLAAFYGRYQQSIDSSLQDLIRQYED